MRAASYDKYFVILCTFLYLLIVNGKKQDYIDGRKLVLPIKYLQRTFDC